MPFKMAHIGLTSRAAQLLIAGSPKNLIQVSSVRQVITDSLLGYDNRLLFAQTPSILHEAGAASEGRPVDQRVQMHRLRNNFTGPGLKLSKNRNDLVAEFYDLSKAVIDGRVSLDQLINSKTFLELDEQLNYHIDIMSNNQVVNLLSSLIKMRVNPLTGMVKLLEHEVKFRVNSISLGQIMKLVKFYNAIEPSYEQKQLTDILNNRIRLALNNPKTTVKDLIDIYRHLVSQSSPVSLLALNEEKLLNLLTDPSLEEDDIVSRFIPKLESYNYVSLCNIFIELAAAKRRPTPLLRAASSVLAKLPAPEDRPDVPLLIATLNSLVSLNYINRPVVSRLMKDLESVINLGDMDLTTKCNLLRSMASLKWRSNNILDLYYGAITKSPQNLEHKLISTLLHVTAKLNYKPGLEFQVLYNESILGSSEELADQHSRKWLDRVWSLAILSVADQAHFESILNDKFVNSIKSPGHSGSVQHSDAMKLLNVRAIASLEKHLKFPPVKQLDALASIPMQRGSDHQKFSSRIREALSGITKSEEDLMHNIETPFGFIVDCVVGMNDNLELVGLDKEQALKDLTSLPESPRVDLKSESAVNKLALVYVLFDEVITNHPMEPIGHKRVISRILERLGFRVVYLPEGILNREKTSADLSKQIKELMILAIRPSKPSVATTNETVLEQV